MKLAIMAIELTQGLFALVDGEDFEWLNQWKWYAIKSPNTHYAVRNIGKRPNRKRIFMHREIMNVQDNREVDHKNHCGLDNRKSSLRVCTHRENQQNKRFQKSKSSQFKGIYWDEHNKKWHAQIQHKGQRLYLGLYDNEIDAAKIYDTKAKELFGEFANTNF